MGEVITVVTGKVGGRSSELEEAYVALKSRGNFPVGLKMSFLARDAGDAESYSILTVWDNLEALERMRSTEQVPAAVAAFTKVGVEPKVSILQVRQSLP